MLESKIFSPLWRQLLNRITLTAGLKRTFSRQTFLLLIGFFFGVITVTIGMWYYLLLSGTNYLILLAICLTGLAFASVVAFGGAYLVIRTVLHPLRDLQHQIETINSDTLETRLTVERSGPPKQIVDAVNGMLDRLHPRYQDLTKKLATVTNELHAVSTDLISCEQLYEDLLGYYQNLQKHNMLLVQILGIGHLLQRNLNPGSLFQEIVQAVHYTLGFDVVVLSLIDEGGNELRIRASVGLSIEERRLMDEAAYAWEDFALMLQDRFRMGSCYFFPHEAFVVEATDGHLTSGHPLERSVEQSLNMPWHPEDSLFVPIELRPGQVEGIFSLGQPRDGRRPDKEVLQALDVFASQTATAIENARLYGQVQQDLVERKRTAQQLHLLNEKLEDRVRERTQELAQTNKTLQSEILERQRAEETITASLKEKEMLLQEIHHRVKNNLQVISSLLSLQAGYVSDEGVREILRDSQNRVRSMALVHERLYRSDNLAQIDLAEYIRNLSTFLFRSYSSSAGRVDLDIRAENVPLGIDRAVPCGLILNELISNALKHAFPGERTGQLEVGLQLVNPNRAILSVCDDGIGFPADFDFDETDSLGLQLVQTLVDQLDGTLEIAGEGGTTFKITFPPSK